MSEKIIPVIPAARSLVAVEEDLHLAPGHVLRVRRPKEPGVLLDLDEVHEHFTKDEYMPYWATLWPVAQHLARFLLVGAPDFPRPAAGARALELGCGLGVSGCAALQLGMDVTLTDYDQSALEWALENARLNAPPSESPRYRAFALDIRSPPAETFDLILASDLIYEARHIQPLVATFAAALAPGGTALVADQNRPYVGEFKKALADSAFTFSAHPFQPDAKIDPDASGTIYVVRRAQRQG